MPALSDPFFVTQTCPPKWAAVWDFLGYSNAERPEGEVLTLRAGKVGPVPSAPSQRGTGGTSQGRRWPGERAPTAVALPGRSMTQALPPVGVWQTVGVFADGQVRDGKCWFSIVHNSARAEMRTRPQRGQAALCPVCFECAHRWTTATKAVRQLHPPLGPPCLAGAQKSSSGGSNVGFTKHAKGQL